MEICDLHGREFKIAVLKKTQRAARKHRQLSELRKQINKQNEYFTKKIETFEKNQTEILEKNSLKEIKNELVSIGNRADQKEEELVILKIEI